MTTPISIARTALASPRILASWAMLGYGALFLFLELVRLLLPGGSFSGRAAGSDFRSLTVLALPVLAVLLSNYVTPTLPAARLISLVALIEYGVALVFGVLTLLAGLPAVFTGIHDAQGALGSLRYLVLGLAALVLLAIAAYVPLRLLSGVRAGSAFARG